jgi:DNA helicase II / ATP-dependent DNA helicase PcrA
LTRAQLARELNGPQLEAVTTLEGPVLILAGAGSGKTRVITFRIAHLLDSGVPQSAILALTFTNKAAREMAERVRTLTGASPRQLTVCTFHSFGARFLREHIGVLGYRQHYSIYDSEDRRSLIRDVAVQVGLDARNLDLGRLEGVISDIKTGHKGWQDVDGPPEGGLRGLYDEYQAHLRSYSAVDFDDLITLPREILRRNAAVLAEVRERYRFVLVDEFQDTSGQQYDLLRLLADESRNLCVVGDDDQSIYSWRGASYRNLVSFEEDFPERRIFTLDQNYRSTGRILRTANDLIVRNKDRKPKKLWTAGDEGERIGLHTADDEQAEGEFIAARIKSFRVRERAPWSSFGILVRTNGLTRPIEEALRLSQIPYKISGGMSFYDRREVRDILAYLKLIANPDDDLSLLRVLNTPRRGIGRKSVEDIGEVAKARTCSLYAAIGAVTAATDAPVGAKVVHELGDFVQMIEGYRERLQDRRKLADSVAALVDEIGYWGHLVSESKRPEVARWRFDNVESLVGGLRRYQSNPDNLSPSLRDYLHLVTLLTSEDDDGESLEDRVNLMTIHSAKGLEFPTVFVAGVEEGVIPHARSVEEGDGNVDEERRLFYVAITRARRRLFLSNCRSRTRRGEIIEAGPSPFLEELPQGDIEVIADEEPVSGQEAEDHFATLRARFGAPGAPGAAGPPGVPGVAETPGATGGAAAGRSGRP